ncbi:MAG: DNRLRE domain-containing protein [Chitinophagaceae bacterium]
MKLFFTLLGLGLGLASWSQTTITIVADKDNTIYAESANSNGAGAGIFFGANQALNRRRGLLHFNLSAIPTDAIIATASLNLFVTQLAAAASSQPVQVNKLTSDWGEGTSSGLGHGSAATTNDATWANRFTGTPSPWTTAGGDFEPITSGSTNVTAAGAFSITGTGISADVQSWINSPASNMGWILAGNEGLAQSAMSVASKENTSEAQRPALTITFSTLPVSLSSFTAQLRQQDVVLDWATRTELNNLYFGVEYSTNGRQFTEITRVTGAGNTVLPQHYQYTHFRLSEGQHFYRLAQHDADGHTHYSQVVLATIAGSKPWLRIAGYLVSGEINLLANVLLDGLSYVVINSQGQLVGTGKFSGKKINVQSLAAGSYRLVAKNVDGQAISSAFVKE